MIVRLNAPLEILVKIRVDILKPLLGSSNETQDQLPANLDRAEAGAENERATIASRQAEQFAFRFSQAELLRARTICFSV